MNKRKNNYSKKVFELEDKEQDDIEMNKKSNKKINKNQNSIIVLDSQEDTDNNYNNMNLLT